MSKQSLVLGCDPGMTGAIAVTLQDGRTVKVFQVPTGYRGSRKELDLLSLMRCLAPLAKHDCVMGIEDVFTFGSEHDTPLTAWQLASALWGVRGIAVGLGMRVIMIPARDWKSILVYGALAERMGKPLLFSKSNQTLWMIFQASALGQKEEMVYANRALILQKLC